MIPNIRALYGLRSVTTTLAYMLQSVEYRPAAYLGWFWRIQDFSKVMHRRTLDPTRPARMLQKFLLTGMVLQILVSLVCLALWFFGRFDGGSLFGLALLLSYPVVWAHLVVLPLIAGREFGVKPQQKKRIASSGDIFANHKAVKIAVAGSYGKTSMKELLLTVLGEGKRVAATPANRNVASSHADFAHKLKGNEEVLVIEYGEGKPGDVHRFAKTTQPTHGVITGLAPAHLDQYKTLRAAAADIFSLADFLNGTHVYVNSESPAIQPFLKDSYSTYDAHGALGWRVSDIHLDITGTSFTLTKGKQSMLLKSGLLGKHNVGPLSLAAALGIELGLSTKQVKDGVAKTAPFEHRMQPYSLGGAWVIDDTYNGNLEGIRAGTSLLAALPAPRKWYVTPGLVDQGTEAKAVHTEMGRLIAAAKPDVVVLMRNSATQHIQEGLAEGKYAGELKVEYDPLDFYQNLEQFVAAGDLVLMQNDWTDNYA